MSRLYLSILRTIYIHVPAKDQYSNTTHGQGLFQMTVQVSSVQCTSNAMAWINGIQNLQVMQ